MVSGTQYSLFHAAEQIPLDRATGEAAQDAFSDYVVYVDESGDHSLTSINPDYPVFVLSLCVFHKRHYAEVIVPAIEKLKFNYFGHDSVVLHEHDIRKQTGDFSSLTNLARRKAFTKDLSHIMEKGNFILIACVVDKTRVPVAMASVTDPYQIAMRVCLEGLYAFVDEKGQAERRTHVVVERRGKKEDNSLELAFRRICDGDNGIGRVLPFDIVMASKQVNSAGLQLADLVARPVGLHHFRPEQPNRAFEILKTKFLCRGGRTCVGEGYEGVGLKIYPASEKRKAPVNPPKP